MSLWTQKLDALPTPASIGKVGIIVVNYNGQQDLDRCFQSLIIPDYAEVILVDNASSDRSIEFVRQHFPHIKIVESPGNVGFGEGNNLGVRATDADYLVFLNPDTVVTADWLEELLQPLEENPHIGMTTSKILLLADPEQVNTCGNNVHFTGIALCREAGKPAYLVNDAEKVNAVSGAAFAMRKDVFNAIGGFDPLFFMYVDDTDLSWRARQAGYECLFVPQSVIYHNYRLRFGKHKIFYQERNRYLMLLKSLSWRTLASLVPGLLLAECLGWGFTILQQRNQIANKLHAYGWIVRHWHVIMEARQQTMQHRQLSDRELLAPLHYRLEYENTGASSAVNWLTHGVFDPLFFVSKQLALLLMRRS